MACLLCSCQINWHARAVQVGTPGPLGAREVLRWIRAADRVFWGAYRYRRFIDSISPISRATRSARYRRYIDDISTISGRYIADQHMQNFNSHTTITHSIVLVALNLITHYHYQHLRLGPCSSLCHTLNEATDLAARQAGRHTRRHTRRQAGRHADQWHTQWHHSGTHNTRLGLGLGLGLEQIFERLRVRVRVTRW